MMNSRLFSSVLSAALVLSWLLGGVALEAQPQRTPSPVTFPADVPAMPRTPLDGLSPIPAWSMEGNQEEAYYGYSVATAGDVNGDGYADVIVGAPTFDGDQTNEGRVFVYHGTAAGLEATPAWMAGGDQMSEWFGRWVATAGDVNGDGYDDVLVGAPYYDQGQADEGRVLVYHGSAAGLEAGPAWTVESDQESAGLGWWAATAGDVNGDGYDDVIVGAYKYDHGETDEGRALVYCGSAAGLAADPCWMAEGDQASSGFGWSVATAGDVNGDGYSDVIVGAHAYTNDQAVEGAAFVYHGSAAGLASDHAWMAEGNQASAQLGVSVATAGDVNRDGYDDVVVGAPFYDGGETWEGRALVYCGSVAGLATDPCWLAEGDESYTNFGVSVAAAGDVNRDGYDDVIVGADAYSDDEVDEGRALVYHGSAAGLATSPAWTAEGNQVMATLGSCVSTAGDVNGDVSDDVVVGAPLYDNGQENEGRAFVYHGSSDRRPPVADAGADQVVDKLALVTLDGSASFDVDGDYPLAYEWQQTGGTPVAFTPHLSVTTFTAPGDPVVLTFTLVVTDSLAWPCTTPDEVVVRVHDHLIFLPLAVRH